MRRIGCMAAFVLACWVLPLRAVESWPMFRGPTGQGLAEGAKLPLTWSETSNVKWKAPIHGKAWSSPVVLGNQVWLTTATVDGRQLSILCVDRETGKILRDQKLFDVAAPQYCHPFNSYGSPTPIIEAGRIYVTFGSPGTACLDTETGKVLWQRRDFICNHFRAAGSSPILFEDLLIMHFDGSDYQYVVALDKKTGQTVWKTDRSIDFQDLGPDGKPAVQGDYRKAFSTPVIARFDENPILVSLASKALYAYNPRNGEELWRTEERSSHSGSPTPLIGHGMIFMCTGLSRGDLWAVRPGGKGVVTNSHVAWKMKRNVPTRSSPILVGDLIFMADDGGIASCIEAKSGREIWRSRIKGNFSASPIAADGKVYFFSEDGPATIIEAAREFKPLAENTLDAGCMASPAVVGNTLFVRTKTHLYRIESPAQP